MMTPAEQLKEEHEGISLMLRILEKVCAKMEAKGKINLGHLDRIMEFFKIFVDQCHHGKEEDLLFPAIIPMEQKLIGLLLREHSRGRSYVQAMGQELTHMKKFEGLTRTEYTANAQKYIVLMTQHIQKEDNVLFPMVDRLLGEKKQRALVEGFEDLERRKIGEGVHEGFHKLLHELKEIYLN
ncbi:MAG: hemerythrin domain-containing protein [Syntrophales bacterium]